MNQYLFYGLISFIILVFLYTFFSANRISSDKAKEAISSGKIKHIIDVRTKKEWDIGHYEGAVHKPVTEISRKVLDKNNIEKDEGILVYCNTGQRARYAADKMKKLGYRKVYYIYQTYTSLE